MLRLLSALPGCLFFASLSLAANSPTTAKLPPPAKRTVDFVHDVQPIFQRACVQCHGSEKQRGGLRLDLRSATLAGGNSGKVVEPGKSDKSRLIHLVAGLEPDLLMPPGKGKQLTSAEIGLLRAWIDQGAKGPADEPVVKGTVQSRHWAFQPIQRSPAPQVANPTWVRNPLDAFILNRLEKEKITPSAVADRATLMRRVYLDVLGLPPTPEEAETFLQDRRADAYERMVDRVLASPHYGERWGRHWLDLARYADSDGYEKDTGRPHAWRYRHWVIDALNRDSGYDQFTIEQLAGDLLPGATVEQKVATGFHRNTLTNREGGVDREQFRVEAVVDRVNTTARVWLGLTLGCAQCHDHKYDPLSQREYYQFFAFFNSDTEVDIAAPVVSLPKLVIPMKVGATGVKAQTLALGKTRKTNVMIRGDFLRPGVEVKAGTPVVLPAGKVGKNLTRLDLAKWLVDRRNPLTARVTVNWVWQKYFARGLVATLEDFGTQGEKPSHPELLDWLADEFMRQNWSLKQLHRLILTSATYRQSSAVREEIHRRDPYNLLLARQVRQRLEAEVIRDVTLSASGLLCTTIGGQSVRPPQPAGISELTYAGAAKWVESGGRNRYRRGIYTWFQRTSPYPMLMTFDAPDANLCTVKRDRSNTPLQALTLLNDTVFLECARALAQRVMQESGDDQAARVKRAFQLCTSRTPSEMEQSRILRLHEELRDLARKDPTGAKHLAQKVPTGVSVEDMAAWVAVARTLLNLDEVVTRE